MLVQITRRWYRPASTTLVRQRPETALTPAPAQVEEAFAQEAAAFAAQRALFLLY